MPPDPCVAVVAALKFRNAPVEQVVGQARDTAQWLSEQGIDRIYLKYCSTSDRTLYQGYLFAGSNCWPSRGCVITR